MDARVAAAVAVWLVVPDDAVVDHGKTASVAVVVRGAEAGDSGDAAGCRASQEVAGADAGG
ncbi:MULTISPECIES: hypothetical protein [unclassified Mycobacterium]|uniref:hypothetical protein n=1 Tax=unclassified Mycobacterium TaxID=2642494 RepID=UPI0014837C20|nr:MULTISPECIES: hypothetical protein [unclassified Mycobacterium]